MRILSRKPCPCTRLSQDWMPAEKMKSTKVQTLGKPRVCGTANGFLVIKTSQLQGRVKIRGNEWVNEKHEEQFYSS